MLILHQIVNKVLNVLFFYFVMMSKNCLHSFVCLVTASAVLSSCASLKGDVAKDKALTEANKKAKMMGLKVGSSCKYIGFIGSGTEQQAIKDGKIKMKLFSVKDVGNIFKKCTYVYGR